MRSTGNVSKTIRKWIDKWKSRVKVGKELGYISSQIRSSNGYLARREIEIILEKLPKDESRLEKFGFKVYSQGDEDGVIEEIFGRLGVERGYFVEIGVGDGLECNSLYLLHKGWRGCWIERRVRNAVRMQEKFASIIPSRLNLLVENVTAENIDALLRRCAPPNDVIDFLSIDIDGNDIYLLEALKLKPKLICIEYNAKFPANLSKKQTYDPHKSWRGTDYMGASLKAIADVAVSKNYTLVGTNITGANAFLVRDDLAGDLFPYPCTPENLYNPPRYWLISDHFSQIGHRADFGPYADMDDSRPA
ncbi:MAG: hypothetical protein KGM15_05415 [Pseudomonadota bacterium]|nr:hypothetical protein [Pseudomonadota bacterium]